MSERRPLTTAFGALLLATVGFGAGAGGSAWLARYRRAEPWRAMRVEHSGVDGVTTRTRVVFEDPKLALQDVELIGNPDGAPARAHVGLRDGQQLTLRFGDAARPIAVEGADGATAELRYEGTRVGVSFVSSGGRALPEKLLRAPVELRGALHLAAAAASPDAATVWRLPDWLVGQAQAAEDETVTVEREISVRIDVGGNDLAGGTARVEASCPPFSCVPVTSEIAVPGTSTVRIQATGSAARTGLGAPQGSAALGPFRSAARDERRTAARIVPHLEATVAAIGVTAIACARTAFDGSICVRGLDTGERAAAVIDAITTHRIETDGPIVEARAEALYYEDRARQALSRAVPIEVCINREGHARACSTVRGDPFAEPPLSVAAPRIVLRRGLGGTLVGSFEMRQSDGADCRFSPSPKTTGTLRLSSDEKTGTLTALLKADGSGTRPNLTCSMGTANMRWTQNYTATLTQQVSKEQLQSTGKLALKLSGTMVGTGSYSFSNCRSSGGASANCPGGKRESYSYPVELTGELDLATQTGSGRILVQRAPLATSGSWRIPAEAAP